MNKSFGNKNISKPATPVSTTAAVSTASASGERTFPDFNLLVKVSKESDLNKITGLFSTTNEKGTFYKAKVNQDITIPAGSYIYMYPNTPKSN